jgi:hypothetical protein
MILFQKISLSGAWTALFLSSLAAVPLAPASARASTDREDIVEMEKLEVIAKRYEWRYAQIEDFEILSALDNDKRASEIIQRALQIIGVFKANSPLFQIQCELPTRIILIKNQSMQRFIAAIDEKTGARIEQDSRMQSRPIKRPEIQGTKSRAYSPKTSITYLTRANDEQAQIVMYIPEAYRGRENYYYAASKLATACLQLCLKSRHIKNSNLTYTFTGAKILSLDSTERGMVRRDDGDVLFPDTVWYAADRAGVSIRRFDYKRERIIFQHAASDFDKSQIEALSKFMAAPKFILRDVLEYPEMFRTAYDATDTMRTVENYITYKRQISDFSIYCVFSPDGRVREGYVKLLNALRKQSLNESLFKECFGVNYAEFHSGMYAFYRNLGKDNHTGEENHWGAPRFTVPMPKDKPPPRPEFRAAGRGERARMFSEWFQACKAPHLAREMLAKAEEQHPPALADPEFAASYGLHEARHGDKAKALALLEKASGLKTTRPGAYRVLAGLRVADIKAKGGRGRPLSEAEVSRVVEPLEVALGHPRHHIKTHVMLARAWRLTAVKPPEATLRALADVCSTNPDNLPLLSAAIPLLRKNGLQALADEVLEATAQCVLSEQEAVALEKLRGAPGLKTPAMLDDAEDIE